MTESSLITASLKIEIANGKASDFIKSLGPDNHERIDTAVTQEGAEIVITDRKISTIVNVIDDLLRCFEVFEKIEVR
jgi:CTP-dependent riboflavin kinase